MELYTYSCIQKKDVHKSTVVYQEDYINNDFFDLFYVN